VSHALDQVRLFGLDEVSSSVRQYDLSVAYISLGLALTLNDEDDGYDGDDSDESPYSKIEGVSVEPEFRSWWARGWALRGRKPLWGLGFEGL